MHLNKELTRDLGRQKSLGLNYLGKTKKIHTQTKNHNYVI
jgi:hypothetical protein